MALTAFIPFAVTASSVRHPDSTAYFDPNCFRLRKLGNTGGCHPTLVAYTGTFEVQKRWHPTRPAHLLASVSLGEVRTGYDASDIVGNALDSARISSVTTLTGGGELNLTSWLHLSATAGYRVVSKQRTSSGIIAPSGFVLTSLLLVGIPY